jgi:hypothetical protein
MCFSNQSASTQLSSSSTFQLVDVEQQQQKKNNKITK